jgi:hypothetical protein
VSLAPGGSAKNSTRIPAPPFRGGAVGLDWRSPIENRQWAIGMKEDRQLWGYGVELSGAAETIKPNPTEPNEVNSCWVNELSCFRKKQTQSGYQVYFQSIAAVLPQIFDENGWTCYSVSDSDQSSGWIPLAHRETEVGGDSQGYAICVGAAGTEPNRTQRG